MQGFRITLEILSFVFSSVIILMMVYQLWLSMYGFKKKTKDYRDMDPESRFLVLVPAHNEEKVIGDIIKNLQHMEYPKHLYDFFIIADNCTDNTSRVAREMGARVIETKKKNSQGATGKPIALKKALKMLDCYQERYDLLMIFDADNLLDVNMFAEVNSQYLDKGKPEMIQCYLGSKNKKGMIAWFYYTCFTVSNRFSQLSRMRQGLNCGIGGTGYAISTRYLFERGGWTTMSLTEDFEIQIEATLKGKRILWNHNTRIYDEKPTAVGASLKQRIRWAQGQWYVCLHSIGKIPSAIRNKTITGKEAMSVIMYMGGLFANMLVLFQTIVSILYYAMGWQDNVASQPWIFQVGSIAIFLYSFLGLFYAADMEDNGIYPTLRTLPLMLISTVANLLLAMTAQLVGLLLHRRQNQWVKTEHSLNQIEYQDDEEDSLTTLVETTDTYKLF